MCGERPWEMEIATTQKRECSGGLGITILVAPSYPGVRFSSWSATRNRRSSLNISSARESPPLSVHPAIRAASVSSVAGVPSLISWAVMRSKSYSRIRNVTVSSLSFEQDTVQMYVAISAGGDQARVVSWVKAKLLCTGEGKST